MEPMTTVSVQKHKATIHRRRPNNETLLVGAVA